MRRHYLYRSAVTGRFVSKEEVKEKPAETVKERIEAKPQPREMEDSFERRPEA